LSRPKLVEQTSRESSELSWRVAVVRSLSVLFGFVSACLASAASARDFDVDLLWQLQRAGAPVLSPNGRWIALTLTSWDMETNATDGDIWLIAADGSRPPRRLTTAAANESMPFWSPDSRRLGFVAVRDTGPAQLQVLELSGGEPQALTALPVAVRRAQWHPGGKQIVFEAATWPDLNGDFAAVKRRLQHVESDVTRARISESRLLRYWDRYLTDGQVPHLFMLDLATGTSRDLMPGFDRITGFEGFEWDLAPDGGEIVLSANDTPPPYRELDFDLFALDLIGGELTNLTPDHAGADVRPVYGARGRDLLFGRNQRAQVASDFTRLMRFDRTGGTIHELAPELDAPKHQWRVGASGRDAVFTAELRGRVHLYRAAFDGGSARRIASGGSIEGLEAGSGSEFFLRHGFDRPPDLFRLDSAGEQRLTRFNAARLAAVRWGSVLEADYPGTGDVPVHLWVVLPPGHTPTRRWPLLLLAHGGPFSAWNDAFSYRWNPHLLAAQGYIVALPNWHGSTGFGQAWADSILGNHGEKPATDMLRALHGLTARRDVDARRVAIMGGSYGGYLATLLTGMTNRFAAAIVHAGVFDIGAQFASDAHWDRPSTYGNAPWTDPVELDRWSPSRFVPRMNTPTLILHGERDFRVPVSQGINLHGALTGKGVPARIVIFPDESHWIQSPQASRLWHHEVFGWLDRHVKARSTAPRTR
jgi:dipeptidyl aminopeptidase/acylaminoacyl peptidase